MKRKVWGALIRTKDFQQMAWLSWISRTTSPFTTSLRNSCLVHVLPYMYELEKEHNGRLASSVSRGWVWEGSQPAEEAHHTYGPTLCCPCLEGHAVGADFCLLVYLPGTPQLEPFSLAYNMKCTSVSWLNTCHAAEENWRPLICKGDSRNP